MLVSLLNEVSNDRLVWFYRKNIFLTHAHNFGELHLVFNAPQMCFMACSSFASGHHKRILNLNHRKISFLEFLERLKILRGISCQKEH